jgi:hypothetical protein
MMDRTRLRLGGLLIAHILATMALDQFADYGLAAFLVGCLFLSQIGLLAIGLIFGTWRLRWRVGTVVAATAALVLWQWHIQANFFGSLFGIVVPELSVAAGLSVARYGPPKLRLIQLGDTAFPSTRFQFSLRQVMTLFVVVALTLSAARPIRAYVETANISDGDLGVATTIVLLSAGTVLLGIILVSWVTTWASLGIAGLSIKITLALLNALALGSLATYCFAPLFPDDISKNWYLLPALLASQTIFQMTSLMVVRSCGFRLVGRKEMAA